MAVMKPPTVRLKLAPVLVAGDLAKLLEACMGRDFSNVRDAAIIWLLASSGAGLAEIAGLTVFCGLLWSDHPHPTPGDCPDQPFRPEHVERLHDRVHRDPVLLAQCLGRRQWRPWRVLARADTRPQQVCQLLIGRPPGHRVDHEPRLRITRLARCMGLTWLTWLSLIA